MQLNFSSLSSTEFSAKASVETDVSSIDTFDIMLKEMFDMLRLDGLLSLIFAFTTFTLFI